MRARSTSRCSALSRTSLDIDWLYASGFELLIQRAQLLRQKPEEHRSAEPPKY